MNAVFFTQHRQEQVSSLGLTSLLMVFLWLGTVPLASEAFAGDVSGYPDLECRTLPAPPAKPKAPSLRMPTTEEVNAAKRRTLASGATEPARSVGLDRLKSDFQSPNLRVAIWGDSHMAGQAFAQEWVRLARHWGWQPQARYVSPVSGWNGVRSTLRKVCIEGAWKREPAHAQNATAEDPSPSLVHLVSLPGDAVLRMDLRDASRQAQFSAVDVMYKTGDEPVELWVSINGDAEQAHVLPANVADGVLHLEAAPGLALVNMKVSSGRWTYRGLRRALSDPAGGQLDVFAYPGSTFSAWSKANVKSLAQQFSDQSYDWVVIAFGTNEANDPKFEAQQYRRTLETGLQKVQTVFPQAKCLLIGPPDRGVMLPVLASPQHGARAPKAASHKSFRSETSDSGLFKYSAVHAEIGRIQHEVATTMGCASWNVMSAMGGWGGVYEARRDEPARMSPDLIHMTAAGYRQLAQNFVADMLAMNAGSRGRP